MKSIVCFLLTIIGLLSFLMGSARAADPFADNARPTSFKDVLLAKQRELLVDVGKYVEQHPDASDRDEAFAWGFDTSRKFGLEADALPLAEQCLRSKTSLPVLKTVAKQVLCLGLAKSGKFNDAVTAFQDSLQLVRFNGAGESLDLAVELAAQAELAKEHTTAKGIYETMSNRLGLNPQVREFCENRLKKLDLAGNPASELELTDLGGQPVSVSDAKGKVLLIDFWATNCPPCLAEFPKLKQLYADYHEQGFEVVGLSLDESRDNVEAFQARAQLPWRLVVEAEQVQLAREKYRVRTIPSLFLIGRDGHIAHVDLKGNDLRQAVERCLAQKLP